MARLAEGLSRLFGRVEVFALGGEEERRAAERALAKGHVLEARAFARALLLRVPGSPLGLALWAEAAEGCGLHDEVVSALEQLVEQVPWRQEVWLRLGQAALRSGSDRARGALERAAAGTDDPATARQALLMLADLDIAGDDCARAARWLDRIACHPSEADPELALRRAECAWALGHAEQARNWAKRMEGLGEGGRARLLRARLAHRWPDETYGGDAISLALGAFVLDAPGAEELLTQLVASSQDAALVDRVRRIASELDLLDKPQWQAAFALAEGRRDDARQALLDGVASGDEGAASSLLILAEQWHDLEAMRQLAQQGAPRLSPGIGLLLDATELRAAGDDDGALTKLEQASGGEMGDWARQVIGELVGSWVPPSDQEPARWDDVLRQLRQAATTLDRLDLVGPIEALVTERQRPLFVAVLGEFNAGKSTLLNALLGTDVAPTGVRPTTASLHWVAWAPDPFARVVVRGGSDRVVPHDELKRTLAELQADDSPVERVFIYAPIERLKRIELLDTPGFNAPNVSHATEARRGIEEAHVALWLLDATAPLKNTERQVIEQVASAGVPIQFLVNKRDRMKPDQLDQVMSYVTGALAQVNIRSLRPPVAMSAQLALRGRLGDQEALDRSGWAEVEDLLAEHIVNRCDGLRERALRRKAARLAAQLIDAAAQRGRGLAAQHAAARERREFIAGLASQLRGQRAALAAKIVSGLEDHLARLRQDARPMAQLSAEQQQDAEVRGYLTDRTVARLAPGICEGIVAHARQTHDENATLAELTGLVDVHVRSTLGGAAAAHRSGAYLHGDALNATIEMALSAAADALTRAADDSTDELLDQSLELRLTALAEALTRPNP